MLELIFSNAKRPRESAVIALMFAFILSRLHRRTCETSYFLEYFIPEKEISSLPYDTIIISLAIVITLIFIHIAQRISEFIFLRSDCYKKLCTKWKIYPATALITDSNAKFEAETHKDDLPSDESSSNQSNSKNERSANIPKINDSKDMPIQMPSDNERNIFDELSADEKSFLDIFASMGKTRLTFPSFLMPLESLYQKKILRRPYQTPRDSIYEILPDMLKNYLEFKEKTQK